MTIRRIRYGSPIEERIGYCRAVVAGGFVHVAGTVGQGDTVEEQCRTALGTIGWALRQAGCSFEDAVRVTYYLPAAADFEKCWPILSETFGDNPPAATMIECGLINASYRIEIELTALAPRPA